MIHTMFSPLRFDAKPEDGNEVKKSFFSSAALTEVPNLETVKDKICCGYSINPALVAKSPEDKSGPSDKSQFISQELWFVDVDNFDPEKPKKYKYGIDLNLNHGISDILDFTATCDIRPFLIYETFSSTHEYRRFRVAFHSSILVIDSQIRLKYIDTLIRLFRSRYLYVDNLRSQASTFYGTNQQYSFTDFDAHIDNHVLTALETHNLITTHSNSLNCLNSKSFHYSRGSVETETTSNHVANHTRLLVIGKQEKYTNLEPGVNNEDVAELYRQANLVPFERFMSYEGNSNHFTCTLPGHADKHPSAWVKAIDRGKGTEYFYHCRGCNAHLSGVEYVRRTRHVTKWEALGHVLQCREEVQLLKLYLEGLIQISIDHPKVYTKLYFHLNGGNCILNVLIDAAMRYGYLSGNELFFALSDALIGKRLGEYGISRHPDSIGNTRRKLIAYGALTTGHF